LKIQGNGRFASGGTEGWTKTKKKPTTNTQNKPKKQTPPQKNTPTEDGGEMTLLKGV